MVTVKIINGIYGYRPIGRRVVVPTSPKDPPISVDDLEGKRLVKAGIARYVEAEPDHHDHSHEEAVATAAPAPEAEQTIDNMAESEDGENALSGAEDVTGHLDADSLKDWTYEDLKALAADMGIDTGKIRKKDALIEAICEVEVTAPAEAIVPEVEDVVE